MTNFVEKGILSSSFIRNLYNTFDIFKTKNFKICFSLDADGFLYDDFFKKQIMKKKLDHSYRIFKKVNRDAAQFPSASEYSWGERGIQVWCSNDYLGMSAHPKVKDAVK